MDLFLLLLFFLRAWAHCNQKDDPYKHLKKKKIFQRIRANAFNTCLPLLTSQHIPVQVLEEHITPQYSNLISFNISKSKNLVIKLRDRNRLKFRILIKKRRGNCQCRINLLRNHTRSRNPRTRNLYEFDKPRRRPSDFFSSSIFSWRTNHSSPLSF